MFRKKSGVLSDAKQRWDTNLRHVPTANRKSGTSRTTGFSSKKYSTAPVRIEDNIVTVWVSKQCS